MGFGGAAPDLWTVPSSVMTAGPTLRLDDDELSTCVACGLCLPHCPTFRVTGEERYSPRGRIDAMRAVQWRGDPVDDELVDFMVTCVQCRGCEPACPSGVPFGRLMDQTRASLTEHYGRSPWWARVAFPLLRHRRLLAVASRTLALAQRARLVPRRVGLGRLPLRRGPAIAATGDDVWLFTGCVMDAWMRDTHRSTAALLDAAATTYAVALGGCCGALAAHAGQHDEAVRCAEATIITHHGEAPVLVNSAGCGAAMKEYGHLLGTDEARAFASRVLDVHEWLAGHLPAAGEPAATRPTVIVQDPCHLRHVQGAHTPVRTVLAAVAEVAELDDDGLCCGAGGAFSATQPRLAGEIRDRKLAAIGRAQRATGARIVASANPGCIMHLRAAGVDARHPVDIVAAELGLR